LRNKNKNEKKGKEKRKEPESNLLSFFIYPLKKRRHTKQGKKEKAKKNQVISASGSSNSILIQY